MNEQPHPSHTPTTPHQMWLAPSHRDALFGQGLSRTQVTEKVLQNLANQENSAQSGSSQPRRNREVGDNTNTNTKAQSSGHHIVQKYITNPHLIDSKKWTLSVPVLVTSLEPLRIYASKSDAFANFACTNYDVDTLDFNVVYSHNSKCGKTLPYAGAEVEGKVDDSESVWEAVEGIVIKTFFAALERWKEDLENSRDMFFHAGSRPMGSGGGTSNALANALALSYAERANKYEAEKARSNSGSAASKKKKKKASEGGKAKRRVNVDVEGQSHEMLFEEEESKASSSGKMRPLNSNDLSSGDVASINGGGFHAFFFDFLLDDAGKMWLLDVDSFPNFDVKDSNHFASSRDERLRLRVASIESIVSSSLKLSGWIEDEASDAFELPKYFQSFLQSGGEGSASPDADADADEPEIDAYICSMYSPHFPREDEIICNIRLAEMRREGLREKAKGQRFKRVHPTVETCSQLKRNDVAMSPLDGSQCSALLTSDQMNKT